MRARVGPIDVEWTVVGDGAPRPWLVLIHCLGGSSAMWWQNVGRLATAHRVLAYDVRGHGASTADAGPCSVGDLADDGAALMRHLGIDRATVIGASMGGMIAQLLAARHPERVGRLVLANSMSHVDEKGSASFRDRAARARSEGTARLAEESMTRYFSDRARREHPDVVDRVHRIFASMAPDGYARACEALAGFDARPDHPRISAPVLVIGSEEDPTSTPEMTQQLARSIPNARAEILPRGAHLACVEEAEAFNDVVVAFLGPDHVTA